MKTHEVKILPEFFAEVANGRKRFAIRKNDRDYQVGDLVRKVEIEPDGKGNYSESGMVVAVEITYILRGCDFEGITDGYCVFGFEIIDGPYYRGMT